jgi:hypothetical protein
MCPEGKNYLTPRKTNKIQRGTLLSEKYCQIFGGVVSIPDICPIQISFTGCLSYKERGERTGSVNLWQPFRKSEKGAKTCPNGNDNLNEKK